jgi:UDP-glucose/iron transport system permease protein
MRTVCLILAGISPLTAIRGQIVVMYVQSTGTALAALIAVRLAENLLFDDAQRADSGEPAR